MRVKIDNLGKSPYFGEYLGLVNEQNDCDRCGSGQDTVSAVVRPDHFGLMLMVVHPSRVQPVTPQEEEDYR